MSIEAWLVLVGLSLMALITYFVFGALFISMNVRFPDKYKYYHDSKLVFVFLCLIWPYMLLLAVRNINKLSRQEN
jgi:hypothetical protein